MTNIENLTSAEEFEELFKDRFTANDEAYNEIKSKTLPPPAVIHPWKIKRSWNKNWDYSAGRSRDNTRFRHNDHSSSHRDRSRSPRRDDSRSRRRDEDGRSNRHYEERNSHRQQDDRSGYYNRR